MDTIDIILDALEVAQVYSEDSQLQSLASELRALICQKLTSRSNDEWLLSEFERNPEQWRNPLREKLFAVRADQDERLYQKAAHIIAIAPERPFGSAPGLEPERDDRSLTEPDEDQYPPTTVRPSTPPPLSGLPTPSPAPLPPRNSPPPIQCSNVDSSQRQTRTAFGWSQLVQWISQTPQSSPTSLEDELRRLETGKILLSAPQSMKLGISSRIKVRISQSETQTLFDDLSPTEADQAEVRDIKVGKWMHVALQGDDFKIQALTDEEQLILDDDVAYWDWSVKPLKAGLRKLWIRATVTVKSSSEQARKQLPVLEKEITVQINPIYSATNFVTQHWQWIVASAAIPIAGLLLKK